LRYNAVSHCLSGMFYIIVFKSEVQYI
jgi:hypothetical protein